MNSDKEQIINNKTLAPLKEFYAPQNMNSKDANILASISKATVTSLESTLGSLTHFISNLKIFKECLVDSINLQSEKADMTTKYARDIPKQSHTLPGIISTPMGFDIESIRSDNERMIQVKEELDKILKQKEIYLRMCEEDMRLLLQFWKKLTYQNSQFDEFIEALNDNLNQNY